MMSANVHFVIACIAICAALFVDVGGLLPNSHNSGQASYHLSLLTLKFMAVFIAYHLWFQKFMFKAALSVAYLGRDKFALAILKYLGPKRCPLWFYQDLLPDLPLPKVEDSVRKWLESIKPIVNEDQLADATAASSEFLQSDAAELQKVLVQCAKASPNGNWLENFWLEFAYLRCRDSLATNVNFFCTDSSDNMFNEPFEKDPCRRLAQLISAAIDFKFRVDNGTLECLRIGGTVPVCMNGFKQVKSHGLIDPFPQNPPLTLKHYPPESGAVSCLPPAASLLTGACGAGFWDDSDSRGVSRQPTNAHGRARRGRSRAAHRRQGPVQTVRCHLRACHQHRSAPPPPLPISHYIALRAPTRVLFMFLVCRFPLLIPYPGP